jgi:threonine/homoserine/homoserine lactone efflux protein
MSFDSWFLALENSSFFLKAAFVGFAVAAPIGPIGILCMRQNLAHGFAMGIVCGIAVSLADGFYSFVAAMGANIMNTIIHDHKNWFYVLAGSLLIFIGYQIFTTTFSETSSHLKKKKQYLSAFVYTLFLTLASPMTTFLFIAAFTAAGVFKTTLSSLDIVNLVVGVSVGAMAWWTILAVLIRLIRKKLNFKAFLVINKISGFSIMGYGLFTFLRIFF